VAEVARAKSEVANLKVENTEHDIRQILKSLYDQTGHDFSSYKRTTLLRRILRRLQVRQITDLLSYSQLLRDDPDEARQLLGDLLISVTQFFRDNDAFEVLSEQVIKPLFDKCAEDGAIRVWVAGCATGEEAYSIAMLILEEAERRSSSVKVQIFASDLDDGALAVAREGRYLKSIEEDVSDDRLKRFFIADGIHYRIRKEVRELILFTNHSLLKDPPFIRVDLISCRNLLIYMERELQQQIAELFHYALNSNCYLFLGSAETVETFPQLFEPIDRETRIYRSKAGSKRPLPSLQHNLKVTRFAHYEAPKFSQSNREGLDRQHIAALEQYAPPSILVDESHTVQHLSPSAGRFIMPSVGPLSSLATMLVRPELRVDLKLGLERAFAQNVPTLSLPASVRFEAPRITTRCTDRWRRWSSAPSTRVLSRWRDDAGGDAERRRRRRRLQCGR